MNNFDTPLLDSLDLFLIPYGKKRDTHWRCRSNRRHKMIVEQLERLVENKLLRSYEFGHHNDTGEHPYMQLRVVFPDGTELVVLPEGKRWDGLERIGLFFHSRR